MDTFNVQIFPVEVLLMQTVNEHFKRMVDLFVYETSFNRTNKSFCLLNNVYVLYFQRLWHNQVLSAILEMFLLIQSLCVKVGVPRFDYTLKCKKDTNTIEKVKWTLR